MSTIAPIGQTFEPSIDVAVVEETPGEAEFNKLSGDRRDAALAHAHRRVQLYFNDELIPELEYVSDALDALLLARAAAGVPFAEVGDERVVVLEAEVARLERERERFLRMERALKVERGIVSDGFVNDIFRVR